jgi:hypothetical protein
MPVDNAQLLDFAVKNNASDLHFAGSPAWFPERVVVCF